MFLGLFHFQEFNLEDEALVGADGGRSVGAVGQFGGDIEYVGGAGFHELQALCPAFDDLVEPEGGGLVAAVGAVEDGAVDEFAFVVDGDGVGGLGVVAVAFGDDFVLQSALGDLDAVAAFVLFQEADFIGGVGDGGAHGLGE